MLGLMVEFLGCFSDRKDLSCRHFGKIIHVIVVKLTRGGGESLFHVSSIFENPEI